jgi:hypothetical protein
MDKELIKQSARTVVGDRPLLLLIIGQWLVAALYILIVGLSIHASDVTVYVRYTAYGEAHFYKSYWQYQLLFVLFGILVATAHTILAAKLHQLGRRQSAIFAGWMGIVITVIALVYALAIIALGRAA